jgi:hypothetical protein
MGYTVEDEDEDHVLGTNFSINGLRELKAFFKKQDEDEYPALVQFFEEGFTEHTKLLALECRILAELSRLKDKSVSASFKSLAKSAYKAKGFIALIM